MNLRTRTRLPAIKVWARPVATASDLASAYDSDTHCCLPCHCVAIAKLSSPVSSSCTVNSTNPKKTDRTNIQGSKHPLKGGSVTIQKIEISRAPTPSITPSCCHRTPYFDPGMIKEISDPRLLALAFLLNHHSWGCIRYANLAGMQVRNQ